MAMAQFCPVTPLLHTIVVVRPNRAPTIFPEFKAAEACPSNRSFYSQRKNKPSCEEKDDLSFSSILMRVKKTDTKHALVTLKPPQIAAFWAIHVGILHHDQVGIGGRSLRNFLHESFEMYVWLRFAFFYTVAASIPATCATVSRLEKET